MLVAVDGSRPSDAALAAACFLVRQYGGEASGCLVLPMRPQLQGRHVQWLPEGSDQRREAAAIARAAEMKAAGHGVPLHVTIVDGDPVDELLNTAEAIGADSIVVGNRGQNALSTLLLGSVAQGITERSRVPVLLIHDGPVTDAVTKAASATREV